MSISPCLSLSLCLSSLTIYLHLSLFLSLSLYSLTIYLHLSLSLCLRLFSLTPSKSWFKPVPLSFRLRVRGPKDVCVLCVWRCEGGGGGMLGGGGGGAWRYALPWIPSPPLFSKHLALGEQPVPATHPCTLSRYQICIIFTGVSVSESERYREGEKERGRMRERG